ncbi:hypothetical protein [Pedobacter aquatilis]|uniref:hypothetical protein n=1 Tax=Pedobacter aquatilis TaxID=351343 RepID=UPI00292CDBAD|nr:hypothetical protein [Pedobacter aquatilis]
MQLSLLDFNLPSTQVYSREELLSASSQFLLAHVFADEFEITGLELSGAKGLLLKRPSSKTFYPWIYDHLALISFSAIAGLTVATYGRSEVAQMYRDFPDNALMMRADGLMPHYEKFRKYVKPVARHLILDPVEVQWNTILCCFDFLLKEEAWIMVEALSVFMEHKWKGTFSEGELTRALKELEAYEVFKEIKLTFRAKRYPLKKVN